MKIPLTWLEEFVKLPKDTRDLTDKLTMVGHMLDKKLEIDNQTVLDLELRGNRADCYSIYGIAREVAAIYDTKPKELKTVTLSKGAITTKINIPTPLVKRVGMIEITNVKIQKSPKWLSERLKLYGIDSVNNIVDLTNYVMIETGEPMHAFDADKVGKSLEIRLAHDGEKITTFQGTSITLKSEDLVWAKEGCVLSVAGAIGEKYNSISETTKNVLLESAGYDQANIRKSVYRHGLLTEAGIRHEKQLDPNLVETAIGRFLYLLQKNNWGKFKPVFYDYYPKKVLPWKLKLSINQLWELGGVEIDVKTASKILELLNFKLLSKSKDSIEVLVPTYRTDVTLDEDLIEEVLRIYGYDKIPADTLSLEIPQNITPEFIKQEDQLHKAATATGLDEAITSSFVKEKLSNLNVNADDYGYKTAELINPPSPDFKYMRQSLLPNLLLIADKIINERGGIVKLFEIGKIYSKFKNKYQESRKFGIVYYRAGGDSFTEIKGLIDAFCESSGLPPFKYDNSPKNIPLKNSFSINLGNQNVGFGGKFKNVYFIELDLDNLLEKSKKYIVKLWPKYPPQIEDLTLLLPPKTHIGDIVSTISMYRHVENAELKDVYKDSYTFRIWYQDPTKTMTDAEVSNIRTEIIKTLKTKFGAQIKE